MIYIDDTIFFVWWFLLNLFNYGNYGTGKLPNPMFC